MNNKPFIKACTLCSGYDSQCMALDRLKAEGLIDYELVAWSEIDKYAIQAHNLVYPQWADRNVGDMTKVDWTKVEDFDLLTYSTPCLTADSLILTKEGYKPITEVQVGDEVLTKSNTWHKVAKKFDNGVHPTIFIKALGFDAIHCTPNHKFLVRRMKKVWHSDIRRWKRELMEPSFVEAKDLDKGCFLGMPIEKTGVLPKWDGTVLNYGGHDTFVKNEISQRLGDPNFWYLMGRFVGDGWIRESSYAHTTIICCAHKEAESFEKKIIEAGFKYTKTNERTVVKFTINSKELTMFVKRYGRYAHGKKIDGETMALPQELIKAFLAGYIESDGSYTENEYKLATVSRELAYGIAFLINKAYGRPARVYFTKRKPVTTIEGREVNQRDSYSVVWHPESRPQDHSFIDGDYIWYPYQKTILAEEENVYNIEVEEDHSYIVQGCISKNCTDFSNAGLQKGGEEGSGTRSSVLWWTRYAILEKKPKYLLMENVKALVSNKFRPLFFKWLQELESYGYRNYYQVLNAKDYGVPQNRERIFVLSVKDEDAKRYHFPAPFELDRVLKDVLEPVVDDTYYLSEKSVEGFLAHNAKYEGEGSETEGDDPSVC